MPFVTRLLPVERFIPLAFHLSHDLSLFLVADLAISQVLLRARLMPVSYEALFDVLIDHAFSL